MCNCYSIEHIAEDHLHKDITCSIEEPQQKYRLGTVSKRLPGVGEWGGAYICFTGLCLLDFPVLSVDC